MSGATSAATLLPSCSPAAGRRPALAGLDLDKAGIPLDAQAGRFLIRPPGGSATRRCSSPATRTTIVPSSTRPPTKGASPATTRAATPTCARRRVARPRRSCSPIPRWPSRAPATPTSPAAAWPSPRARRPSRPGSGPDDGPQPGGFRVHAGKADGRLLGAELFGPDAEHLAHLLAWAIQRGDTVTDALAAPFYHPVVEEGCAPRCRTSLGRRDAT